MKSGFPTLPNIFLGVILVRKLAVVLHICYRLQVWEEVEEGRGGLLLMVWLVDCRNVFVLDTHCVRNLLLGGFWSICYTVQLFFSKVLFEMKRQGVTPNAFTYGYYNQVRAALL